ncbi:MAG: hypothetical protein DHS20C15_17040 [Planctomycetota bacterium]|nr:MAG: hypothetical protein DHS20C15_17040 [Planctomycetota bacterium]
MSRLVLVATRLESAQLPTLAQASRVVVCGLGPVAAALGAAAALAERPASEVLLVGLAGSRDLERAPLGALALGSEAWNECVGVGHGREFLDLQGMGLADEPLPADVYPLQQPPCFDDLPAWPLGTVAAASASAQEAAARGARRPQVLLEEMEAWGVAQACERAGVPLAVLRAVSNAVGDRDHASWAFDAAFAALDAGLARWLAAEPRA